MRMITRLLASLSLAMIVMAPFVSAAIAKEQGRRFSLQLEDRRVDGAAPRTLTFAAGDTPSWLPRVMRRLRQTWPGLETDQQVLFRRGDKPTYLAVTYRRRNWPPDQVVLYRVNVRSPGDVRLAPLVSLRESRVDIVEPSGQNIHDDGVAQVFIAMASLGSGYEGYRLRIFRLDTVMREVTPQEIRALYFDAIDDSNHNVLVASDDNWARYYQGCGSCGPFVTTLYRWRDGAYRPACREFKRYYEQLAADSLVFADKYKHKSWSSAFTAWLGAALELQQIGEFNRADEIIRNAFVQANKLLPEWQKHLPLDDAWLEELVHDTSEIVAQSAAMARQGITTACPLLGLDSD